MLLEYHRLNPPKMKPNDFQYNPPSRIPQGSGVVVIAPWDRPPSPWALGLSEARSRITDFPGGTALLVTGRS